MPQYIKMPELNQNDPQIREYTDAIQRGEKIIHIFINDQGWVVKRLKDSRARIFSNKTEALEHARNEAEANETEVIMHGKDGRILERQSYGQDPYPPQR